MENKEIYIDGIDVSEWTDEEVKYKFAKHSPKAIRQIAFDLYKQLTRKEQECEELKEERNEYFELMAIRTEVLAKIANKLGMNTGIIENKELFCKIDQLKAENEHLSEKEEEAKHYLEEAEKFKKCLTEIKEIAKENIRIADLEGLNGVYRCGLATQILQKINECEVEDERKENCN